MNMPSSRVSPPTTHPLRSCGVREPSSPPQLVVPYVKHRLCQVRLSCQRWRATLLASGVLIFFFTSDPHLSQCSRIILGFFFGPCDVLVWFKKVFSEKGKQSHLQVTCARVYSNMVAELGRTMPRMTDASLEPVKTTSEGRARRWTLCTKGCAHDHARNMSRTRTSESKTRSRSRPGNRTSS